MPSAKPIGVFDSGYGGLTILKDLENTLPGYDFVYLGDNARAPYGTRSFESVYRYTLESVKWFFDNGSPLVVLACNTASAKALRTIQQHDLPKMNRHNRVLGVIRPTTEVIGNFTKTNNIGILATTGTVQSNSYKIEIEKFFPGLHVFQQACPMWVPLIENNEHHGAGADYFVRQGIDKLLAQSDNIDTILLGCTHYPLLIDKIRQHVLPEVQVVSQGKIVSGSLADYLQRHPEMDERCSKNGEIIFYTTDSAEDFNDHAAIFYGKPVRSKHLAL
ncbi:MAG TPA: glutamate racemase [Puia sp.]|nr:glutamate racemase [Puia sp.]